jgi:hypothetical protein
MGLLQILDMQNNDTDGYIDILNSKNIIDIKLQEVELTQMIKIK